MFRYGYSLPAFALGYGGPRRFFGAGFMGAPFMGFGMPRYNPTEVFVGPPPGYDGPPMPPPDGAYPPPPPPESAEPSVPPTDRRDGKPRVKGSMHVDEEGNIDGLNITGRSGRNYRIRLYDTNADQPGMHIDGASNKDLEGKAGVELADILHNAAAHAQDERTRDQLSYMESRVREAHDGRPSGYGRMKAEQAGGYGDYPPPPGPARGPQADPLSELVNNVGGALAEAAPFVAGAAAGFAMGGGFRGHHHGGFGGGFHRPYPSMGYGYGY